MLRTVTYDYSYIWLLRYRSKLIIIRFEIRGVYIEFSTLEI